MIEHATAPGRKPTDTELAVVAGIATGMAMSAAYVHELEQKVFTAIEGFTGKARPNEARPN